jgi:peroxiredoxin
MILKTFSSSFVALSALLMMSAAHATMPGEPVKDFKLTDHQGKVHTLYQAGSTKPIVVMIQGNGCPIVRHQMVSLKQISEKYAPQGVRFLLLNPNLQDNAESISKEVAEFGYPFPVLVDSKQVVGEAWQVQRTSEVFVIDPTTRKLAFRGPLDDRVGYERQRPATKHYLIDALDALLAGQPVKTPYADGVGCLVNFPNRKSNRHMDHGQMNHSDHSHADHAHDDHGHSGH